ncbi:MAG: biotin synthase BioB, partial [Verrucomicrobia bacterium]|nr:biotin synthase BioB [Verrucomicrobiota bacterium]
MVDRIGKTPKTFAELSPVYRQPLFSLLEQSRQVYRENWGEKEGVQLCRLLSIKTGGCSEDCGYCAQSSRYNTGVKAERLMDRQAVLAEARQAKDAGAGRFCMGAAWKGVKEGEAKFESVLNIVRDVKQLGMEVCVTLGQLTDEAARQLKDAGVTAYNHNLDTSPEHYSNIVTTHSFEDRLRTIRSVQKAGMSVCCGGILGMGESEDDRLKMLEVLCG